MDCRCEEADRQVLAAATCGCFDQRDQASRQTSPLAARRQAARLKRCFISAQAVEICENMSVA